MNLTIVNAELDVTNFAAVAEMAVIVASQRYEYKPSLLLLRPAPSSSHTWSHTIVGTDVTSVFLRTSAHPPDLLAGRAEAIWAARDHKLEAARAQRRLQWTTGLTEDPHERPDVH